ncbi:propionyl-CoA synthetase [Rhizobium sp. NRK18]|uniref:propionyl-CoA synthetase n=1 Tax=Rhizobium sp. NRK18 TaxID=2964667 RepID=UPI0021C43CE9|nr:propionyl-CoA synthetase [Rhizobium sp. NRK18]MCQ2002314.1 propionyl-CoA synthetase [Rhizobium sp. NRK18]
MADNYKAAYAGWQADPFGFWKNAAESIDWSVFPQTIFDPAMGTYGRWFPGGITNTCYNCIDRHVIAGNGEQAALIYESAITGRDRIYTYQQLFESVNACASVLKDFGVGKGDRVIIYMPMIPEAVFAMLACARIGAVHSVVFGGFAAHELAKRIEDSGARIVISASCGLEPNRTVPYKPLLDHAIEISKVKPDHCLIVQRPELRADLQDGRDHDLRALIGAAQEKGARVDCEPVDATDPLYVLYTSGTTGQPKGVVRDNGGHMVALIWSMRNIYGVSPGETYWAASDIGWVVGHSYIVYAPLLNGNATILFEGKPIGTPDAGVFWRVINKHNVRVLFTAPTAFRAIRKEDPNGDFIAENPMPGLRALFLAGERADPDTLKWAEEKLKVPVIDHWWQTETGWPIAGNPIGLALLPVKHGSPAVAMPGYDLQVLDDAGHPVPNGTLGNVVVKLPLPPGCLPTFWNADERFHTSCLDEFPGYYKTADAGYLDEDGYIFIMARTDDIVNVAGHRLSTGAMEEVCAMHPDVAECAVIGIADPIKGQVPCGFLVLNNGADRGAKELEREIVALIREEIGPVAAFKMAIQVKRLPKTRSGKILRGTMQKIADGMPWTMPATIEDPAVLDEITEAIRSHSAQHAA